MRDRFQVRVSAGEDPSTSERIILTDSVHIEQPGNVRSERSAQKEAEKLGTHLLADADELKVVTRVARDVARSAVSRAGGAAAVALVLTLRTDARTSLESGGRTA